MENITSSSNVHLVPKSGLDCGNLIYHPKSESFHGELRETLSLVVKIYVIVALLYPHVVSFVAPEVKVIGIFLLIVPTRRLVVGW